MYFETIKYKVRPFKTYESENEPVDKQMQFTIDR